MDPRTAGSHARRRNKVAAERLAFRRGEHEAAGAGPERGQVLGQDVDEEGRQGHCSARGFRLGRTDDDLPTDLVERLLDPQDPVQELEPLESQGGQLADQAPV